MDDTIECVCVCGKLFSRPKRYLKISKENPTISYWKFQLKYCDECFKKKIEKSLLRLPEILSQLSK